MVIIFGVIALVLLLFVVRLICRKFRSRSHGKGKFVASLLVNLRAAENLQRKSRAVLQLEEDAAIAQFKASPDMIIGTSDPRHDRSHPIQETISTIGSDSTVEL